MRPILAALMLALLPQAAAAQAVRATYEVRALGSTVLEIEARLDLAGDAYRVETVLRTRGIAAVFVNGQQVSRVQGGWAGGAPVPRHYASEGEWRGNLRRIVLDWRGGAPRVLDLVPPNDEERDPVPEALMRGTVDALSAVAGLTRLVMQHGHCDLTASVFDGRRRSDFAARSEGREVIRIGGASQVEALRCAFEGRQVAGFRRDQDQREAATPQRGTAWIAPPFAGAPPLPVRLDIATRWFGTASAVLTRAEPG